MDCFQRASLDAQSLIVGSPRLRLFGIKMNITCKKRLLVLGALTTLLPSAAAVAGGDVLPSGQSVAGHSLASAAQATAVYNSGVQAGNPLTPAAPTLPFNLLVPDGNVAVLASEYTYMPVFVSDNSPPVDPSFPASIANQGVDAAYLDGYVLSNYDVSALLVQVDGKNTVLDDSYITGVNTSTLLDGTPGGNEYISSSVFLSPLSIGDHTISIGGIISGEPVIFVSYDVKAVVPEPTTAGLLGASGLVILARRPRR